MTVPSVATHHLATPRPPAAAAREDELRWVEQAIALAESNVAAGGGPFGALVVRDGKVTARSGNQVTKACDPTAHAEVMAIRLACARAGSFRLTGATLVSSCEPCPMCIAAALWARIQRIVFAADRDVAAAAGFDDREFYDLMERPRDEWPMPVVRVVDADAGSPFAAWSAAHDRIDY